MKNYFSKVFLLFIFFVASISFGNAALLGGFGGTSDIVIENKASQAPLVFSLPQQYINKYFSLEVTVLHKGITLVKVKSDQLSIVLPDLGLAAGSNYTVIVSTGGFVDSQEAVW